MTESHQPRASFLLALGDLRKSLTSGQSYTVGSSESCDLRLNHGTIEPAHCRIEVGEDQVVVRDLGSTHGTRIGGETITERSWAPGEILEVGSIQIRLEMEPATEPVPIPMTVAEAAAAFGFAPPTELTSHRTEPEFGEIVFGELKRAPWFALSLIFHAVLLVLLWFANDVVIPPGSETRIFSVQQPEAEPDLVEEVFEADVEIEEEMQDVDFSETESEQVEEESFFLESDYVEPDAGLGKTDDLMTKVSGSGLGDILQAGKGSLSRKFKKTVAGLRKNGLEIVFVFDSTGSMGEVLQAAKTRMEKMVSVMLELVPFARIGVITYRDKGDTEEYLTREVQLSRDLYRSINFLQHVYAAGGGDEPEAVYEALHLAVRQKWNKSARRLVILIGDAPPHKRTQGRISSMVKSFSHNGRSFVHTITTMPSGSDRLAESTAKSFRRIAKDGKGEALAFKDEGKILKAVMSLAFGREDRRSLDEVYRLVESRNRKASRRVLKMLETNDIAGVRKEFTASAIPHDVIKAILQQPTAAILNELIDIASEQSFNTPGRHAAAYILKRAIKLEDSPVDPVSSRSMSARRAKTLKVFVSQRFK